MLYFRLVKALRKILYPFSLPYQLVTQLRNTLYNRHIKKSYSFTTPVIAIGNLSTGGTGKTPQTEYLIRLLKQKYNVAVLSRGYRRKTNGYLLADTNSTANTIGDEPYQMYSKFPDITLAVDADRKHGIEQLLQLAPPPDVILMDDAYQHRRVQAGFYILLTAYTDLFTKDVVLPAGNLREGRAGASRAAVIVVTKCPPGISAEEQQKIIKDISRYSSAPVFFTTIAYDTDVYNQAGKLSVAEIKNKERILIAGIAKPKPFFDYLAGDGVMTKAYADHHDFSVKEIEELNRLAKDKLVITTEKDYVRLKGNLPDEKLYYLPMQTVFIDRADYFDKKIIHYVEQSSANS